MNLTIVEVKETTLTTSVQGIPIYALNYIAGHARIVDKCISYPLRFINAKFAGYVGVHPNKRYIMEWRIVGKKVDAETGQETSITRMEFTELEGSALDQSLYVQKVNQVIPDQFKLEVDMLNALKHANDYESYEPQQDDYSFSEPLTPGEDLPF